MILLVLAFMRPFVDSAQTTALDSSRVMRKVILLDTSASMRRGDLWAKAGAQLKKILAEAGSRDRIAVMTFDTRTKMVLSFDGWFDAAAAQRAALVAGQLKAMKIAPGWAGTHTADALVRAVEALEEDESHHKSQVQAAKQIVLISDLQDGSRLQGLEAPEQ